jgi:hypothetical protein
VPAPAGATAMNKPRGLLVDDDPLQEFGEACRKRA